MPCKNIATSLLDVPATKHPVCPYNRQGVQDKDYPCHGENVVLCVFVAVKVVSSNTGHDDLRNMTAYGIDLANKQY